VTSKNKDRKREKFVQLRRNNENGTVGVALHSVKPSLLSLEWRVLM